jgi:hypothetical protein
MWPPLGWPLRQAGCCRKEGDLQTWAHAGYEHRSQDVSCFLLVQAQGQAFDVAVVAAETGGSRHRLQEGRQGPAGCAGSDPYAGSGSYAGMCILGRCCVLIRVCC